MLKVQLHPFEKLPWGRHEGKYHDSCSICVSNSTMQWFRSNQLTVVYFSTLSPDLNPMENFWRIVATDIYANRHQFAIVQEPKLQIERSWFYLNPEFLQILF